MSRFRIDQATNLGLLDARKAARLLVNTAQSASRKRLLLVFKTMPLSKTSHTSFKLCCNSIVNRVHLTSSSLPTLQLQSSPRLNEPEAARGIQRSDADRTPIGIYVDAAYLNTDRVTHFGCRLLHRHAIYKEWHHTFLAPTLSDDSDECRPQRVRQLPNSKTKMK